MPVLLASFEYLFLPAITLLKFGVALQTLFLFPLAVVSLPLFREDFRSKRLPNAILYPTIFVTLVLILVASLISADWQIFARATVIATVSFFAALVLYLFARGGLGAGDVKLFALTGLALGTFERPHVIPAAIYSFFGVALYSILLLVTKRATSKSAVAFGPFIIMGAWISILLS